MEKQNEEANDAEAEGEAVSKWKMVPMELTPEMYEADVRSTMAWKAEQIISGEGTFADGVANGYRAMLAAAPEWEPSDEDVERARYAYEANIGYYSAMRAALKAAFEVKP